MLLNPERHAMRRSLKSRKGLKGSFKNKYCIGWVMWKNRQRKTTCKSTVLKLGKSNKLRPEEEIQKVDIPEG